MLKPLTTTLGGAAAALLLMTSACSSDSAVVETVDAAEAVELLEAGEHTVIDVRTPAEFAAGHVEGALLMPLARTVEMALAAGLPKDEPVYVFCRSGNRSLQAAQALVAAGYLDVRNVDGGILAWTAAGLPVVR